MPPEEPPSAPRTGDSSRAVVSQLTPEQFNELVSKVFELLMHDLKMERERVGASTDTLRRKGIRR